MAGNKQHPMVQLEGIREISNYNLRLEQIVTKLIWNHELTPSVVPSLYARKYRTLHWTTGKCSCGWHGTYRKSHEASFPLAKPNHTTQRKALSSGYKWSPLFPLRYRIHLSHRRIRSRIHAYDNTWSCLDRQVSFTLFKGPEQNIEKTKNAIFKG